MWSSGPWKCNAVPVRAAGRALQVWVRARDAGGLAAEAPVCVHVLAAGDSAPRLRAPPPDLFLREDAAPGALLADLRADSSAAAAAPAAPAARVRLAASAGPDLFAVDAAGRLVLAAPLDREANAEHVIGEPLHIIIILIHLHLTLVIILFFCLYV